MNNSLDMDKKLIEEIEYYSGKLSKRQQERILEVIRAMLFTRKVIAEQEAENERIRKMDDEV